MFYIGNFNYNDSLNDTDNYCLMPAVVRATNAEEALDRFHSMFERIHASSELLNGTHEIYLDSLVELDFSDDKDGCSPDQPVLVQWQKIVSTSNDLYTVTIALPEMTESPNAVAYGWASDENVDALRDGVGELCFDEEPFIVL